MPLVAGRPVKYACQLHALAKLHDSLSENLLSIDFCYFAVEWRRNIYVSQKVTKKDEKLTFLKIGFCSTKRKEQ